MKSKDKKTLSGFPLRLNEAFGNVSRAEIARKMKRQDTIIRNYFNGRIPKAFVLHKMSELTGCSIHWLLTGEGEKYVSESGKKIDYYQGKLKQEKERSQKLVELVRKFQEKQQQETQKLLDEIKKLLEKKS